MPLISLIQTLTVAQHLNFRHAAQALGTSQSSVSARIRMLEEELGILLFERNTRGVRLTEAGRLFVERIAAGIDQLDHAVKTAGMTAAGECGRLRIGVHGLIAGSFLDNLLAGYRKIHPGIAIEMIEATARDAVVQVRACKIDVAFVVGAFELPDCHSRPIWTEALMVALPVDHRLAEQPTVTWDDLAAEQFLVRHVGTGPQVHDHIVLRLAGRWSQPAIRRFEVERGTLLSMVAQGFGVTLVGEASGLFPTAGVALLSIADEPGPIVFSAVWSPHNRSAALQNLFALASEMSRATQAA
ncbi:LysR family transcriptional regulator [Sphingomonas sanguinis]|uniref:LysR family transcriptional regulator n=1 Tax=Sphingomonas sanguinis TaxID=33051 RepID=A0A147JBQ3_9SPHN|nr:LysR family transcriptional regulator [Sphingomonas sanguinis]